MKDFKLLVVDDEVGLANMIKMVLTKEGYATVQVFHNGTELLEYLSKNQADLILLDVMLPDINGFDLCHELRKLTGCPIIFVTARTNKNDKLLGFAAGGDDYLTKPFYIPELVARVNAYYRRKYDYDNRESVMEFGPLKINELTGEVFFNNDCIFFPAKELELLIFLAKHPKRIFSSKELYSFIWNTEDLGEENTVAVHINRIRKKIDHDIKNLYI